MVLGIGEGILGAVGFIVEPIGDFFSGLWKAVCEVFGIHSPAKEMKPLGEYILLGIVEGFIDKEFEFSTAIQTWFEESVLPWFSIERWSELGNGILAGLQFKWDKLVTWWKDTAIYKWWNNNVTPWFTKERWTKLFNNIKSSLNDVWDKLVTWWKDTAIYKWWNNDVKPWFDKKKWNFSGIKDGLKEAWENAIEKIKSVWNNFTKWFNDKMTIEIPALEIGGKKIFEGKSIEFIKLPTFANGGFPEDGLFMANHNELVGQFANGRTAVANNEMIVAGIEEAAYRGFSRAYAENDREVPLLQELISAVREGKTISIDGRELVNAYDARKSRNGYSFT